MSSGTVPIECSECGEVIRYAKPFPGYTTRATRKRINDDRATEKCSECTKE